MPSYEFYALTDTGRVRTNNEDAVAVHEAAGLVLLADGMGGYNAGEVAAVMAIEQVGAELARWLEAPGGRSASPAEVRERLDACVEQANHAILGASLSDPQYEGMGTTLVAGVFIPSGGRLVLGHVGDSRCYRLRRGSLEQLTRDHSWLQEQMDAGLLTPEEAARTGMRNLVTRALGVEPVAPLEVNEFTVEPGDLYLLCSDGLTDLMTHEELAELARQPLPLAEKASRMVALANALGGRDNISVVLAQAAGDALPAEARRGGLVSRLLRGNS
ncbi:PP2C family protein-serine/threonine phosphatase [Pulveribacter suum]|uniref:Protein phosphatase n=1 Tax=Pulveribacter suum TaxID=2116657 RepID=A0A2P1NI93_9BURK|nr:PP2C family serine/threonine-protein phosphatase [Pulveribacter suum]AVP56742.1 protein phosphatase [Pulveribacter suum]